MALPIAAYLEGFFHSQWLLGVSKFKSSCRRNMPWGVVLWNMIRRMIHKGKRSVSEWTWWKMESNFNHPQALILKSWVHSDWGSGKESQLERLGSALRKGTPRAYPLLVLVSVSRASWLSVANAEHWSSLGRAAGESAQKDKLIGAQCSSKF